MKKLLTAIAIIISLQAVGQNIKTVKDTIVIKSAVDINWIKINGELYQIKKWLSVEKYVVPTPELPYHIGTLIWRRGGGIFNPYMPSGLNTDSIFGFKTLELTLPNDFEVHKYMPVKPIIKN